MKENRLEIIPEVLVELRCQSTHPGDLLFFSLPTTASISSRFIGSSRAEDNISGISIRGTLLSKNLISQGVKLLVEGDSVHRDLVLNKKRFSTFLVHQLIKHSSLSVIIF